MKKKSIHIQYEDKKEYVCPKITVEFIMMEQGITAQSATVNPAIDGSGLINEIIDTDTPDNKDIPWNSTP